MNVETKVLIPLEEYDRLKEIEKVFKETENIFDEAVKGRASLVRIDSEYKLQLGYTCYYKIITDEEATNLFNEKLSYLTKNRDVWQKKALDLEAELKTLKEKSFWKKIFV
jgi:hypothetical protein